MNLRTVIARPAERSTKAAIAAVTRSPLIDWPLQAGLPAVFAHRKHS
ncbi:hypothetical protein [Kitasatospora sp. NPDC008115]